MRARALAAALLKSTPATLSWPLLTGNKPQSIRKANKDLATLPLFNAEFEGVRIEMTAPRLEDAFIALLRAQHPLTATQAIPPNVKTTAVINDATVIKVEGVDRWFGAVGATEKIKIL
jgi:pantothenate kinase type III